MSQDTVQNRYDFGQQFVETVLQKAYEGLQELERAKRSARAKEAWMRRKERLTAIEAMGPKS
ncbi:hypothetical protein [Alicyclobacillus ferrooxydans]|uniref:Uncharacterized protein n=1 Tax=Alicyclobacillus ferrooxydans TaxID=471514 RepID=A0A0P9CDL5_9BACL|nr:hypothetical protein [Alicyclobacillus ferrooxydans]KPV43832.1 hypothetical protein AN477_10695 [Alicyclobacillus ferrooxydans]